MFEDLENARKRLQVALEQYLAACTTVRNHAKRPMFGHSQEHSTRMADELAAIIACKKKIARAKKCISQAINHSPFVARINSLPDEILGHIFQLAIGLQPCFTDINNPDIKKERKRVAFAQVPERLSHVCCRWRRLAFSLPTLWQHIDINMDATDVMARAKARTARTGQRLLDVHIFGSLLDDELEEWLALVGPRIKSLTLIVCDESMTYEPVLISCFKHCSPGTLSHLTIWKEIATNPPYDDLTLDLWDRVDGHLEFEDLFLRIESLRLRQLYVDWPSNIYRGLSELHLGSHQSSHSELLEVSVQQLVDILQTNPKLRVLRLDVKIVGTEEDMEEVSQTIPVHLDDLEVLDLSTQSREPNLEQLEFILPLISPGTQPLQFTLDDLDDERYLILQTVVQEFFSRSNVTRLKLMYQEDYRELDFDLLSHLAPQLGHLVLDHYSWHEYRNSYVGTSPRFHERDNSAPNFRIEYLYLLHNEVDLQSCPKLLKGLVHPPRVLVFWKCRFTEDKEDVFKKEKIRDAFKDVCQDVRILKWDAPKPPDDWASDTMPCVY
ncbi:unnamed protein product [Rhizoctonia solani]|uniref:F-box domain-containing protein n=1 Tax=Rhizoctonia solani TaxID=456999 RepID=A0A8H2XAC6_9AGAM|nr:unnamed protein product [Rhizoctonia solani]